MVKRTFKSSQTFLIKAAATKADIKKAGKQEEVVGRRTMTQGGSQMTFTQMTVDSLES